MPIVYRGWVITTDPENKKLGTAAIFYSERDALRAAKKIRKVSGYLSGTVYSEPVEVDATDDEDHDDE